MDVAGPVRVREVLAQRIDRVGFFVGSAGSPRGGIGVSHRGQDIVAVDRAAAGRVHPIDPLRGLRGPTRLDCLQGQRVVIAIIRVVRGLVGFVGWGAVGVVFDVLGDALQGIVVIAGVKTSGVSGVLNPPGRVVGERADQHRSRVRRDGAGPGVHGAAVGTDVHGVHQAVGIVVVLGHIIDAGLGAGGLIAKGTNLGGVVIALAGGDKDGISITVILGVGLFQHMVVGHARGGGPGGAAGTVSRIALDVPAGTIVLVLLNEAARLGGLNGIPAVVVKVIGGQARARDGAGALIH